MFSFFIKFLILFILILFSFLKKLFIYFWLHWVFVVASGLSVVAESRGFSCGARALECRLSSCGTWAQLLHSMWDLPGPGLEPVSPALAGGFLTTVPPGKPHIFSCTDVIYHIGGLGAIQLQYDLILNNLSVFPNKVT